MSPAPPAPALGAPRATRVPRSVIVSVWTVPVLIVGQFAILAVVPVAIVLIGTLRDARLRALRGWAAALAVAYAVPLALWAIGPDRAPSLSKDIHPVVAGLVVAVAVVVGVAFLVAGRPGVGARRNEV